MPIDDLVIQAMRRWPDVPAVHGWLRLDRRGRWMLIDRGRPDFDESRDGAGSEITSPPIVDFIGRNYLSDAQGRWYWQNGPQRVFVDLDLAPLVLRVLGEGVDTRLVTHTGYPVRDPQAATMDPQGNLFVRTELGPGVVHDLDLGQLDLQEAEPPDDAQGAMRLCLGERRLVVSLADDPARALGFERRPRP